MLLGRITGPMLRSNLNRNGVNLAFDGNHVYLNVNDKRIGINTNVPDSDLRILGTTRAQDSLITTQFTNNVITISTDTISNSSSSIIFNPAGPNGNVAIDQTLTTDNLQIIDNNIISLDTDSNIEFITTGLGKTRLNNDTLINGELGIGGIFTFNGNITIGTTDINNITFVAESASNIVPNINNNFILGKNSQQWAATHSNFLRSNAVTAIDSTSNTFIAVTANIADFNVGNQTTEQWINTSTFSNDLLPTDPDTYNLGSNLKNWRNIYLKQFLTYNVVLNDNYIETSVTDTDLIFSANGTGRVILDKIGFATNNMSAVTTNADLRLKPTAQLRVSGTNALVMPNGSNANRTLSVTGEARYNKVTNIFEGRISGGNRNLYSIHDVIKNSKITPELTIGAADETFRMYINGVLQASLDINGMNSNLFAVDNIKFNNNTISTISNTDLTFDSDGLGTVIIKTLIVKDNTFTDPKISGPTEFINTGASWVHFMGTAGVLIPSGTYAERPTGLDVEVGMHRWNTDDLYLEVFNGTAWQPANGVGSGVTIDDMTEISDAYTLIFG